MNESRDIPGEAMEVDASLAAATVRRKIRQARRLAKMREQHDPVKDEFHVANFRARALNTLGWLVFSGGVVAYFAIIASA